MAETFRFEYQPGTILCGDGIVTSLNDEIIEHGLTRALVVCGSTVGSTEPVIGPVCEGLGTRLAGVFDQATPEKHLATAIEGARRVKATNADVIVGLGGGSSLDTSKLVSVLASHDRPAATVAREMVADGTVDLPDGELLPIATIPTTLAGADLSAVAGTRLTVDPTTHEGEIESAGVSDPRLLPTIATYDSALFETTPSQVLIDSAMNGFDKGIEMIYGSDHTPITDATATHGLRLLRRGLPSLGDEDEQALAATVRGIVLVQYGLSTGSTYRASLIHAFGHGFSRRYEVSQGVIHAILAPHVLRYLFGEVDARRHLLARGLGLDPRNDSPEAVAEAIVREVIAVRDAMGLPDRLGSVDGLERDHFPTIADAILADDFMHNVPAGCDPDAADVQTVLKNAW